MEARPYLVRQPALRVRPTTTYKLYAHNAGTNVLPLTMNKESVTGRRGLYASAVIDINKSEVIVKVSNVSEQDKTVRIRIEGLRRGTKLQPEAEAIVLKGTPEMTNTLEHPDAIVPISSFLPVTGMLLDVTAEAGSFNVYKVGYTGN